MANKIPILVIKSVKEKVTSIKISDICVVSFVSRSIITPLDFLSKSDDSILSTCLASSIWIFLATSLENNWACLREEYLAILLVISIANTQIEIVSNFSNIPSVIYSNCFAANSGVIAPIIVNVIFFRKGILIWLFN